MKDGDTITIIGDGVKHKGKSFAPGNYILGPPPRKIDAGTGQYFVANGWATTEAEDAPDAQVQPGSVTIEPDSIVQETAPGGAKVG